MKGFEIAITALKKLGISDATLEELKDEAKAEKVDIDQIVGDVFESQKEIIMEPKSDYMKEFAAQTRASVLKPKEEKLFKKFKEFGITQEEFDKLPENERFDKLVDLAHKKAKDFKPAGEGEAQKEIDRLHGEILSKDEEIKKLREEEIPAVETKWKNQIRDKETNEILSKSFREISQGKDGKSLLLIDEEAAFGVIRAKLEKAFDLDYSETGLSLMEKGKGVKAKKNSKDLSLTEALTDLAESSKLFRKSEDVQKKESYKEKQEPPVKITTVGKSKFEAELEARKQAQGA